MRFRYLFFLIVAMVAGCGGREDRAAYPVAPAIGESIHVMNAKGPLLFEAIGPKELVVRWSSGHTRCQVSDRIARSWASVRALSSEFEPTFREKVYLDPNLSSLQLVVGFAIQLSDGWFEIHQIEEEGAMFQASESLQDILDLCGLEFSIGAIVFRYQ